MSCLCHECSLKGIGTHNCGMRLSRLALGWSAQHSALPWAHSARQGVAPWLECHARTHTLFTALTLPCSTPLHYIVPSVELRALLPSWLQVTHWLQHKLFVLAIPRKCWHDLKTTFHYLDPTPISTCIVAPIVGFGTFVRGSLASLLHHLFNISSHLMQSASYVCSVAVHSMYTWGYAPQPGTRGFYCCQQHNCWCAERVGMKLLC